MPTETFETLALPRFEAEALLARPPAPRTAAVINHGNPGVPTYLRELIGRFAEAGVAAAVLAGDGRLEPRAVTDVPAEEHARWRTEEFAENYLAMTRALLDRLRAGHEQVALVGFCGGGWQAVRLAAEGAPVARIAAVHAALRFSADDVREDLLHYLPRAGVPLQFHFGGADELTPARDIEELRGAVEQLRLEAEIYVYPGAGHGFLDPDEHPDDFEPAAAALAVDRLIRFLAAEGMDG